MNRRQFLSNVAATTSLAYAGNDDKPVKRVLVMFKCHLDIGFIDTQAAIIEKYFQVYFPQAIRISAGLRQAGEERYVWTTGSWLIYQYLEQAAPRERKQMEEALATGDIAWHALPFSWQTELLDPSAITGCIGFSKSLDRRFGRQTTGAKMTDVPGHSRGIIQPLVESGVKLLDIGVNSASTPPDVPEAFVWKDASGSSVIMLYHRKAYGGVIRIPGSDLAIAVEVRDDNSGPHTLEEIRQIYGELRQQFPSASIQAANLTDIANAVEPFRDNLPVLTHEIGDTWIYGIASDPLKLARYRELLRLRRDWLSQGSFKVADSTDLAFLSKFALAVEHTWGTDTKTWLDFDHYTPDDLATMLNEPKYRTVTGSWLEKRKDIDDAVASLPAPLRAQAIPRLAALTPVVPDVSDLKQYEPSASFATKHFAIALDPATGAIAELHQKANQRGWASPQHPLALLQYQTFSKQDYDRFLASYITLQTDWAPKDFGKPNIEKFGAKSRVWQPKLSGCWSAETADAHRLLALLKFGSQEKVSAWPDSVYLNILLPKAQPEIHLDLSWFGKRANRMPEALWLTFNPAVFAAQNWSLSKVDQRVSPFDVVAGGNRHMHAISRAVTYRDSRGSLECETLDAPLIALGEVSPIAFSKSQPDLSKGIHFNLFNNTWGTNYVQWFGENMRFRFILRTA